MDKRKASVVNNPPPPVAPVASSSSKRVPAPQQFGPIDRLKIISMGSGGCGKSCIIKRYCEDRFVSKYIATIGVDYGVKPVKISGNDVRINFWDLSGHPEFLEIRNEFYKDAQGCLLVFDVCSRESFEELDSWLAEAAKFGVSPRETPIVVCANKIDKKRVVSEEEGRQYAQNRGYNYYEMSAASGQNIMEMFDQLFQHVYQRVKSI